MVIFGSAQIIFCQFSSIEKSWLPSAMGALTAITYSLIALGLCIAKGESGAGVLFQAAPARPPMLR